MSDNLSAMEKLFAGYINERLDMYAFQIFIWHWAGGIDGHNNLDDSVIDGTGNIISLRLPSAESGASFPVSIRNCSDKPF